MPIVKFVLRDKENGTNLEGDISLYNTLVSACAFTVSRDYAVVAQNKPVQIHSCSLKLCIIQLHVARAFM